MRNPRTVPVFVVVALLAIWQATGFGTGDRLGLSGELVTALLVTVRRALLAYGAAAVTGALVGMALAGLPRWSVVMSPAVQGLKELPSICWYPLALLWLGAGEGATLLVTATQAFGVIAAGTESAIRTIPPAFLGAAATMGARGWRLYLRVVLPAALPQWLSGMRAGWSCAWAALLAAEMLATTLGLGHQLVSQAGADAAAKLVVVMLIILALGLAVDRLLFARAERAVRLRWGRDLSDESE